MFASAAAGPEINFSQWLADSKRAQQQQQQQHAPQRQTRSHTARLPPSPLSRQYNEPLPPPPTTPLPLPPEQHHHHAFPEHPNSLFRHVPARIRSMWNYNSVMSTVVVSMLLPHTILIALLMFAGHYNWDHYTYWVFTLADVGLLLIWIGLQVQGFFESLVALLFFPVLVGSVTLVPIIIGIVIALNPEVYLAGTEARGGSLSFAIVRNFDWILHAVVVEVLILLVVGYKEYVSENLVTFLHSVSWQWALTYIAFFIVSPLVPLGFYSLAQDPSKRYPTPLTRVQQCAITVTCAVVIMLLWFCALAHRVSAIRRVPNFALLLHRPVN